jgi:manganese/zinc/iron transport system ATP- binding protein
MSAAIPFWPYGGRPCGHSRGHRSDDRRAGDPAVSAWRLAVGYAADRPVLADASFRLARGRLAALTGANGAGKSTLLRTVAGALPAIAGRLDVLGLPAGTCHHRIAYLPQRGGADWTFPVTAAEVALSGRYVHLGWLARPGRRDRDIAAAALEDVGLSHVAGRRVGELSGGQQQRVLIARALAQEAELLLLDEPTAGLDARASESLLECLRRLAGDGRTVLVSTHDRRACEEGAFDEVLHIDGRRLSACGHGAAATVPVPDSAGAFG